MMSLSNVSLEQGDIVNHTRHGQGAVVLPCNETAIIRFSHGIEEVKVGDLERILTLSQAVTLQSYSPAQETILRAQAIAIRSVNDAWGVFSRSRINLLPHQLWVCHRALRQWPIRLLIADDVGMGKTIEAGLLLWPLIAKGAVRRLLILTPAKLVEQWQLRLRQMFDIRVAIYRPEVDTPTADFWNTHPLVVGSLPTLRADNNGRHDRLLDAPGWDMVIVDEAHHLHALENGAKTLGLQLLENLQESGKINSCVLFTGTPHRGKDYGFWSLMSLLDKKQFGPKKPLESMLNALPNYLIRNAKQKATDMDGKLLFQPVKQYPETFTYSEEEAEFYDLMSGFILAGKAYASSLSKAQRGQVQLVLIALQKLASSSVAAVKSALETRQKRMSGLASQYRQELEDESDDDNPSNDIERAFQQWLREERQGMITLMEDESKHLGDLLDAAKRIKSETRIDCIIEIIGSRFPNQQVLLFTEYKRTQALVVSALMKKYGVITVGFINGDNRLDDVVHPDGQVLCKSMGRDETCKAFNEGKIRFLISTEAGGEGIDLQKMCSALIHVDLPWNPMRLHQRVGRLNRYGQSRTVEVVSLRNPATVESMIWEKLEDKLANIMFALGSAMDEPEDLLQLVLGMTAPGYFTELFSKAAEIPQEGLGQWFDEQTRTFGGNSAIDTIKSLVGHAQSFDLSGLQNVPPMDLPDLIPFFTSILDFNSRRPKFDSEMLSFKTPEKWIDSPAIKREYKSLCFNRKSEPGSETDLVGVGHPLVTRALNQADKMTSVVSVVHGLQNPVLVFLVTDRVTDSGAYVREAAVAATFEQVGSKICLLKDWELLRLLNGLSIASKEHDATQLIQEMSIWIQYAKSGVNNQLTEMNLPFELPTIREYLLLWPASI
jgi:ERCC4-related helicase